MSVPTEQPKASTAPASTNQKKKKGGFLSVLSAFEDFFLKNFTHKPVDNCTNVVSVYIAVAFRWSLVAKTVYEYRHYGNCLESQVSFL